MNIRATPFATALFATAMLGCAASQALAANSPPLSESWNIASSGKATSSGELLFRVTPGNGSDPVEVTVSVRLGTNETDVAGNIRRAFNTQLRADRYNVDAGAGTNVVVTPQDGKTEFSLELIDSDVESIRVVVQSAHPVAPPTVPRQGTPANPPATPTTPPAPGNAAPPANASQPAAPPPSNSPPMPNPSPPPTNSDSAGAPASAPPPNATPGGSGPASAPPPNATPGGSGPASAPPPTAPPPTAR